MISESLQIPDGGGGQVKIHLRRPAAHGDQKFPVLIVLAGVKTNAKTLERAPAQPNNTIITYEYDYDKEDWRKASYLTRAWHVCRMSYTMSRQFEALTRWIYAQPWVDTKRVNVAGGSVGAIYLPMMLKHIQDRGLNYRTITFAYGGASRAVMCYLMLRHHSRILAGVGAALCWSLLGIIEPAKYLPHLKGDFLLIASPDDERIPRHCSKLFEDLTPEPKTIIHKPGEHVDTEHPHILDEVFTTTLTWLVEKQAINP